MDANLCNLFALSGENFKVVIFSCLKVLNLYSSMVRYSFDSSNNEKLPFHFFCLYGSVSQDLTDSGAVDLLFMLIISNFIGFQHPWL